MSNILTHAALLGYAEELRLFGELNAIAQYKVLAAQARRASNRLKNGTISTKSLTKWCKLVKRYTQNNSISAGLLYNRTTQQSHTEQGIERSTNPKQSPKILDPKEVEHVIRKSLECPIRSRHLSKKAYHVLITILQQKSHSGWYAATASGLPTSVNVAMVKQKGYEITWTVGVGKNGDNPHVHYLIRPLKNTNKSQMIRDLDKLNLSLCGDSIYLQPVADFDSYAIYMAENYDELARPGILPRGQHRFGISNTVQKLTRTEKKHLHPRFTKAEMMRWSVATEIIRKKYDIDFWGNRHWCYHYREEIRDIAETLPLIYSYPIKRVSNKIGIPSTLSPSLERGGIWTAYDGKNRIYSLEVQRWTEWERDKQMLHYEDLHALLKEFEMPHYFPFNSIEDGIELLCA